MPLHAKKSGLQKTQKAIGKRIFGRLSFRRDPAFVPNMIICIGVVFVRRGMRNLIDAYFFPYESALGNVLAVLLGIFLLYLPDNSFTQLGGYEIPEEDSEQGKKSKKENNSKNTRVPVIVQDHGIISPLLVSQQEAERAYELTHNGSSHGKHKHKHKHPHKH